MDQQLGQKMKISLGLYEIVEIKNDTISIHIGGSVTFHVHLAGGMYTTHKVGDKIPLLTEVIICHH